MRVLVDTNVVLDVLLNREPWVMDAAVTGGEPGTARRQVDATDALA